MKTKVFRFVSAGALTLCLAVGLSAAASATDTGIAGKDSFMDGDEAFVLENNELWMKSANQFGQLGIGIITPGDDHTYRDQLIKVMDDVASVCYESSVTAAIKTDRSLWMWGINDHCQLGFAGGNDGISSDLPCQTVPVKVMDDVAAVSCSAWHTAAIKTDGSLWMWGSNAYGATGDGKGKGNYTSVTESPVKIMDDVAVVSCGRDFTAAVKTDGSLWAWGKNTDGRLGNNYGRSDEDGHSHIWQTTPVKVMDGVSSVSCGDSDTMVILKTDGTVWACGNPWYYMVGILGSEGSHVPGGNYPLAGQPTPMYITDNAAAIYSRSHQAAVIKRDGSLWTWGCDPLGDGTRDNSLTPVHIANDVLDVNLQGSMFVKRDGTIWHWGGYYPTQPRSYNSLYRRTPTLYAGPEEMPLKLPEGYPVHQETTPIPATGTVYVDVLPARIDNEQTMLQACALTDAAGGVTNYFRLRDLAQEFYGTYAQFEVEWDGNVNIIDGWEYLYKANDVFPKFSGIQPYRRYDTPTKINGSSIYLEAIVLTDDAGRDFTYYKLRDLGLMLHFNVTWSAEAGITIHTTQPYSGN